MKNRYLAYGYQIKDGQCVANPAEAEAVQEIFRFYGERHSYQSITEMMEKSAFPPYSERGWNKHHIKRILENERYTGAEDYPSIISVERFHTARTILKDKTADFTINTDPSKVLWDRILCEECGGRLLRNGTPAASKGIIQLRCKTPGCEGSSDISKDALHNAICELQNKMLDIGRKQGLAEYEPSPEAKRLENQINRMLARPDELDEALALILQGVSARYDSVPSPPSYITKYKDRLLEPDWELFKEAVIYISLSQEKIGMKSVTGEEFSMERKDVQCAQQ